MKDIKPRPVFLGSCPVRERTGDGVSVGRCWFHLPDGKTCPRHGDVSAQVEEYRQTGKLPEAPRREKPL